MRKNKFYIFGIGSIILFLAAYARSRGFPWEDAEIAFWKDKEGIIQGSLRAADLEFGTVCRLEGKPYKPEIPLPAYQTIWSPLPYPNTFEVVTFYGHQVQGCSAEWTVKGSHPLARAYFSRARECKELKGTDYNWDYTEFAWDYVLKSGLYSH